MTSTTEPVADRGAARGELWRRFDAGLIDADQLEARLQLVDRAANGTALAAAVDGRLPARRRVRPGTLYMAGRTAVAVVGAILLLAGGMAFLAIRDARTSTNAPAATALTLPALQGPVVPPVAPVAPGQAASCPAADAATASQDPLPPETAFDAPQSDHLLADPPPAVDGYEVTYDAEQTGAETDSAWSVAAGSNPAPSRTWVRTRQGDDRVEIHAYLYDSHATAMAVGHDAFVTGVCNFNGLPVPVDGLPGSYVLTVTTLEPTAYTGFTLGPVRVVVAAFDADLELARTHAIAVAKAEHDALAALPIPASG
jgi:hypothetical protein